MTRPEYSALQTGVLEALVSSARSSPHMEHCGVLMARPDSTTIACHAAFPGPLRSDSFHLPECWLLRIFLEGRSAGWRAAGFYHTHPLDSSMLPSERDRAGHPPGSFVLLVNSQGSFRGFRCDSSGEVWRPVGLDLTGT